MRHAFYPVIFACPVSNQCTIAPFGLEVQKRRTSQCSDSTALRHSWKLRTGDMTRSRFTLRSPASAQCLLYWVALACPTPERLAARLKRGDQPYLMLVIYDILALESADSWYTAATPGSSSSGQPPTAHFLVLWSSRLICAGATHVSASSPPRHAHLFSPSVGRVWARFRATHSPSVVREHNHLNLPLSTGRVQ